MTFISVVPFFLGRREKELLLKSPVKTETLYSFNSQSEKERQKYGEKLEQLKISQQKTVHSLREGSRLDVACSHWLDGCFDRLPLGFSHIHENQFACRLLHLEPTHQCIGFQERKVTYHESVEFVSGNRYPQRRIRVHDARHTFVFLWQQTDVRSYTWESTVHEGCYELRNFFVTALTAKG